MFLRYSVFFKSQKFYIIFELTWMYGKLNLILCSIQKRRRHLTIICVRVFDAVIKHLFLPVWLKIKLNQAVFLFTLISWVLGYPQRVRLYKKYTLNLHCLFTYRVSHETWQLMNSLECRLPNNGLDLKTFCSLVR